MKKLPPFNDVCSVLVYNHERGTLHWRAQVLARKKNHEPVSLDRAGYGRVAIDRKYYQAHRLCWLLYYGREPKGEIDHINGNRLDNRIFNLRDVPRIVNAQNIRVPMKSNLTARMLGVTRHKTGKWQASITVNGRWTYLGLHSTPELAHAAYVGAKRLLHAGNTI